VPHTESKYDENISGMQVAWYNAKGKSFVGAPKLHTTGILPSDVTWVGRDFTVNAAPITPDAGMDGYGFSATGRIRFPQSGTYTLRIWHDDRARVWVDDTLKIDDWDYQSTGTTSNSPSATFVAVAGKAYRFRIDYQHTGTSGALELWTSGPGISMGNPLGTSHPTFVSPDYSLTTSIKSYDNTLGNRMATTSFGSNPELGLASSATADPSGLNLTSSMAYETPGATGSYVRQTSKTLPGGNTTSYSYYGATETRDNPCTTGTTEAYRQAGMLKMRTEPDPDGSGPLAGRTTETIYDDAGRVVASRYNTDSWTCTTYDSRGRVTDTEAPAFNGASARSIQSDYAVGGSPLETTTWDDQGWIVVWSDLLGRTTKYRDVHDDETTTTYDSLGKITQRVSPLGTETFVYDNLNRLTDQKLDSTTYAHISYDSYSRKDYITYPAAGSQKLQYARDAFGRINTYTYTMGNGTTAVSDTVTRTQSSQITTDVVTSGSSSLWYTYGYDMAGRLTSADIGPHAYSYGFGAESSACNSIAGNNANAGKNSNRTTQTIDGVTTTFCYDQADRLMSSSDAFYNGGDFDTHGNMTSLGTGTTPLRLCYDSSDRNTCMTQRNSSGTGIAMYYNRDATGRIVARFKNTLTNWDAVSRGTDRHNLFLTLRALIIGPAVVAFLRSGRKNANSGRVCSRRSVAARWLAVRRAINSSAFLQLRPAYLGALLLV
jgi:YD repeat-containing protein